MLPMSGIDTYSKPCAQIGNHRDEILEKSSGGVNMRQTTKLGHKKKNWHRANLTLYKMPAGKLSWPPT